MSTFRTTVDVPISEFDVTHTDKTIALGSCFSEYMGHRMLDRKFNIEVNPFGILFNPESIRQCIKSLVANKKFEQNELILHNGQWHSYLHHSNFSSNDPEACLAEINERTNKGHQMLFDAKYLIITFGTAWVYELKSTGEVVANCHKVPSDAFVKRKMGLNEIVSEYSYIISHLRDFNPDLNIVFTVSPVRHWKDGSTENQWSKATLFMAIQELVRRFDNVDYFPAYELMMDDLRDYRFYEKDMLHPSELAKDYIWEAFSNAYFSADTRAINEKVTELQKAANHRPFDATSEMHQQFLKRQLVLTKELEETHALNLNTEKSQFESNLLD
jgi:hypothetical protein